MQSPAAASPRPAAPSIEGALALVEVRAADQEPAAEEVKAGESRRRRRAPPTTAQLPPNDFMEELVSASDRPMHGAPTKIMRRSSLRSLKPPEPEAKEAPDRNSKRLLSNKPLPPRRVRHTGPSVTGKPGPSGPTPEELIHIADEAVTEPAQWTPTARAMLLKMARGLLESPGETPGVDSFKGFCELEAIASLRDFRKIDFSDYPRQSCFEGDDTGPGRGAWISEQAKVVRATKTIGAPMIVCGDPEWMRPLECSLGKNGDRFQTMFRHGPLEHPANSEIKLLRVLGEAVEGKALVRVSVEQKHRAWEMEDPVAKAQAQAEFLAALFRRRDSSSLLRSEQAAAALNLASECSHKAHLYAASLKEWARELHPEIPTDYFGIAIRLAYIRDSSGFIREVKTYMMFVARKDGHNRASEVTQQTYSFQVVLALLGEDAFFWRPILVYPQKPEDIGLTYETLHTAPCTTIESQIDTVANLREWAGKVEKGAIAGRGGPWPHTLNLTPGGEGCGMSSVGDSSSSLLGSAGGFAVALLLWVECEPHLELHKQDAEYKGILVGSLWHHIRCYGTFVRGYPLRVCALTEAKFVWDIHEVKQQKALAVLAKHIAARIEANEWDGQLPTDQKCEVGRIGHHIVHQGCYITGNPNLGNALLEMGIVRGSWCKWLGPGF